MRPERNMFSIVIPVYNGISDTVIGPILFGMIVGFVWEKLLRLGTRILNGFQSAYISCTVSFQTGVTFSSSLEYRWSLL